MEIKLLNHLIGTDTSVKLDTLPICIGIGTTLGIDVGSVEKVLRIIQWRIQDLSEVGAPTVWGGRQLTILP